MVGMELRVRDCAPTQQYDEDRDSDQNRGAATVAAPRPRGVTSDAGGRRCGVNPCRLF